MILTDPMKHRLLGVWIFCVMWLLIPSEVWFYRWLMFITTAAFWFLIALGMATLVFSIIHDRFEDD